ncbi:UNVERIFIED_CONTAM: hypothetical protein K2H54_029281 [Gekko kuhli]
MGYVEATTSQLAKTKAQPTRAEAQPAPWALPKLPAVLALHTSCSAEPHRQNQNSPKAGRKTPKGELGGGALTPLHHPICPGSCPSNQTYQNHAKGPVVGCQGREYAGPWIACFTKAAVLQTTPVIFALLINGHQGEFFGISAYHRYSKCCG